MMEDVQKRDQRRVMVLVEAFERVFGEVEWQRTVRAEQTEEIDGELAGFVGVGRHEIPHRGGCETQVRLLAQTDAVVARAQALAEVHRGIERMEPAHRQVETEGVRLLLEFFQK